MHDPSATPTLDATLPETALGTQPRRERNRVVAAGQAIGRYVVLERLGAGGMGVVFAAYDPQLDRKVAVKLLKRNTSPDGAETGGDRDRLLEEARALAQLSHPNVIAVHDVGVHDGEVFVAMEFVDGVTLTDWQREEGRTTDDVLRVYLAAGAGLSAAHRAGLVHRDFKPDNVMVDREGRARVLDFGLARPTHDELDLDAIGDAHPDAPETLATVGTPAYMAPEQFAGERVDARTDQFAFCVALYEALYGVRPFRGDTVAELATSTLEQRPAFAVPVLDVPPRVADALHRGLEKRAEKRFVDMDALLRQLDDTPSRTPRWLVGLGLAAAVGVAAFASTTGEVEDEDACPRATAVDRQWGPEQLANIERALTTESEGLDEPGYELVRRTMDTYALALRTHELRACSDDVAQRTSREELDARRRCLDRRARQLASLVQLAVDSPAKFRRHRHDLVGTLHTVASCSSFDPLRDKGAADRLDTFDRLLNEHDDAYLELVAGDIDEPVVRLEQILAEAEEAELHWVAARAHVSLGEAAASRGNPSGAKDHYQQAFRSGLAAAHDSAVFDAAVLLAKHLAWNGDTAGGAYWLSVAEALTVRHPATEKRLVELYSTRGSITEALGDNEKAREAFEQAVQACIELFGEKAPHCLTDRSRLADAQSSTGHIEQALENYERVIDLQTEYFGRNNPTTALLMLGHAMVLRKASEFDAAIDRMQETLEVGAAVWGKDGARLAAMYGNYAGMLGDVGRFPEATEAIERALAIEEQVAGPDGLMMSFGYEERGRLAALQGDHEQAEADLTRTNTIRAGTYERSNQYRVEGVRTHAEARLLSGRFEDAVASADLVLEACEGLDESADEVAAASTVRVAALVALGRDEEATRGLRALGRLSNVGPIGASYVRIANWALDPSSVDRAALVEELRPQLGHANLTLAWLAAQP